MNHISIWIEKSNAYLFKHIFFLTRTLFPNIFKWKAKNWSWFKKNIVVDFWYIISNSNWYKMFMNIIIVKLNWACRPQQKFSKKVKNTKWTKCIRTNWPSMLHEAKRVKIMWNKWWYLYLYNKVFIFKQRYFNTICQNQHDIFFSEEKSNI